MIPERVFIYISPNLTMSGCAFSFTHFENPDKENSKKPTSS